MEEGIHSKHPSSNLQLLLPEASTTFLPALAWTILPLVPFPPIYSPLWFGTAGACQQVPVCVSCRDMFSSPAWSIGSCPNTAFPHEQPTAQGSAKKDQAQHV